MIVFLGDKFVDAKGRDVTNDVESKSVVWPVRVYHAPAKWVSVEFEICETTGPYKLVFEAPNCKELHDYQNSKW